MTAFHDVLIENERYVLVTNVGSAGIRLQHPDGTEIAYWEMGANPRWKPLAGFSLFRTGSHLERMDRLLVNLRLGHLTFDDLPH